jgi:hypothetical protein
VVDTNKICLTHNYTDKIHSILPKKRIVTTATVNVVRLRRLLDIEIFHIPPARRSLNSIYVVSHVERWNDRARTRDFIRMHISRDSRNLTSPVQ